MSNDAEIKLDGRQDPVRSDPVRQDPKSSFEDLKAPEAASNVQGTKLEPTKTADLKPTHDLPPELSFNKLHYAAPDFDRLHAHRPGEYQSAVADVRRMHYPHYANAQYRSAQYKQGVNLSPNQANSGSEFHFKKTSAFPEQGPNYSGSSPLDKLVDWLAKKLERLFEGKKAKGAPGRGGSMRPTSNAQISQHRREMIKNA